MTTKFLPKYDYNPQKQSLLTPKYTWPAGTCDTWDLGIFLPTSSVDAPSPSFWEIIYILNIHLLVNHLLQPAVQIPCFYLADKTRSLKITAVFHLQKDSSGGEINLKSQ